MYAVIKTGGKQYKVEPGTVLKVEKLEANEGDIVEIPAVMVKDENGNIKAEGKVKAQVLGHGKHRKVIVFKFKRKKNYKRWNGHRQPYTEIKITEVS